MYFEIEAPWAFPGGVSPTQEVIQFLHLSFMSHRLGIPKFLHGVNKRLKVFWILQLLYLNYLLTIFLICFYGNVTRYYVVNFVWSTAINNVLWKFRVFYAKAITVFLDFKLLVRPWKEHTQQIDFKPFHSCVE